MSGAPHGVINWFDVTVAITSRWTCMAWMVVCFLACSGDLLSWLSMISFNPSYLRAS